MIGSPAYNWEASSFVIGFEKRKTVAGLIDQKNQREPHGSLGL
jgi:hypothetical protein